MCYHIDFALCNCKFYYLAYRGACKQTPQRRYIVQTKESKVTNSINNAWSAQARYCYAITVVLRVDLNVTPLRSMDQRPRGIPDVLLAYCVLFYTSDAHSIIFQISRPIPICFESRSLNTIQGLRFEIRNNKAIVLQKGSSQPRTTIYG